MKKHQPALLVVLLVVGVSRGSLINFEEAGAVANADAAGANNTALFNTLLSKLAPGDTLVVPNKTFHVAGGIHGDGLHRVTIQIDGTLEFLSSGRKDWPTQPCNAQAMNPLQPVRNANGTCVQESFLLSNVVGLTLTSSGQGTLNGNGQAWWGYIKYLIRGENRPRLLSIVNGTDVLVERWRFLQSPYWTFTAWDVLGLEISHCDIDNRVNQDDSHDVSNLAAFNTDGFDVAGRNIHIHDCSVWNQDDCFTIQPLDAHTGIRSGGCTENVLVENVLASGLGLTVGAVHPSRGHNCIRNVTFRHARMHHTFKGIYVKSGSSDDPAASAEITNILYHDIFMEAPSQVPIWIGPAQEADSKNACSLLWPMFGKCPPPPRTLTMTNITLQNVHVESPKQSPGIILGNSENPMVGIVFDNVTVTPVDATKKPWGKLFYHCPIDGIDQASSRAVHGTSPGPSCLEQQ
eukprot:TRINITY_DN49267_c0_g1_i1.p1 TRINITY_DN49267_c0_g1~~TRINITY_DN49267_c0_g1_i1.p1  ORF type:complete len:461 (-),score=57.61 TRINITY_DN49267_c0_g1_i1:259-1641(-)